MSSAEKESIESSKGDKSQYKPQNTATNSQKNNQKVPIPRPLIFKKAFVEPEIEQTKVYKH